jgi:hypothetical protein
VTSVNQDYSPQFFATTEELNILLQKNFLINQSNTEISDEAKEVLCLGLNFIPSKKLVKEKIDKPLNKLISDINKHIVLYKRKETGNKGWLSKLVKSEWTPDEQTWTLDSRIIPLLNKLSDPEERINPVLHDSVLGTLKKLQMRTDIHILKADKGRNTVIWSTTDYDREAERQLSDSSTYLELSKDEYNIELLNIKYECSEMAENLLPLNHISPTEDEAIQKRQPKGAEIYFLPKIHKDIQKDSKTFPGRPIVATFSSVTYLLDKYITEITSNLIRLIPGSLIDTQDFLNQLPVNPLPESTVLVTADVSSLYPNIPWKEGIDASTQFYKENHLTLVNKAIELKKKKPPLPHLFKRILELVLTNSMITFKNKRFFKQTKGTAMGCCISVYFANCYMFAITKNLINYRPPWLISFLRFIDDLFFISELNDSTEINNIIQSISNENIKYEVSTPGKMQNFLDTTITLTKKGTILFAPYSKETASGAYLHPSSTHPQHTILASPYSQLLRIRRISSNLRIYKQHAIPMKKNFIDMGYPEKLIQRLFTIIRKKTLAELIDKKENNFGNAFRLITKFNFSHDWKKTNSDLKTLHEAIITHYEEEGPNKNKDIASTLRNKPIQLVTGNEPNINSFFSPYVKKGKNGNNFSKNNSSLLKDKLGTHRHHHA